MEHIKHILARRQEGLMNARQASVKGSSEWNAFNAVRDDRIEMFPVSAPRAHSTPRYANILHISRQPRHIVPKYSH